MTANVTSEAPPKPGFATFFERSALVMFALGFAAGMPNLLIGQTLIQNWLATAGANLSLIGLLSLVTISYALKFIWSPIVDKTPIPVLDKWLGRRRSWMLLTQVVIVLGILGLATIDPSSGLDSEGNPFGPFYLFISIAALITFAGATQDVAIDAWRIEVARDNERLAILTANYQIGYRVAMFISGALVLIVVGLFAGPAVKGKLQAYSFTGWRISFIVMAVLMSLSIIATLLAPREKVAQDNRWVPPSHIPNRGVVDVLEWVARLGLIALAACFIGTGMSGKPEPLAWLFGSLYLPGPEAGMTAREAMGAALSARPWGVYQQLGYVVVGLTMITAACWRVPFVQTRPAAYLQSALGDPLRDFFGRYQSVAMTILLFICLYRLSDFVLNLASTMYVQIGFNLEQVGAIQKGYGVVVSALSAVFTGWAISRFGLFRCLMAGAFLQPISNLSFILIAINGPELPYLFFAIGVDNFSGMFAGTVFIVYLSQLTKDGFTATQYALFTSLYALPGKLITALGGRIVESFARSAESGGPASLVLPWVQNLPPVAFSDAGEKLGVSGTAYAAGYVMFYFYTTAMGIVGIILAWMCSRGKPRQVVEAHIAAQQAAQADRQAQEAAKAT